MPPSEPPKGTKSRVPKRRRRPPSAAQVQQQAAAAQPLSSKPVRPKRVERAQRAQRQTQHAAPLDATPGRPQAPAPVGPPKGKIKAKPLQAQPPRNIRAGKPVQTARDQRAVAVAAYDQLPSRGAKRAHVQAAQKRIKQGKATNTDKAIVHIHQARVEGTQKVVRAQRAFDLLAGEQIGGGKGLHYAPGTVRLGGRTISPKGEDLGKAVTAKDVKNATQAASVANMPGVGKIIRTVGPLATKGLDKTALPKVIKNIPKDAAELAVTGPSALAKTAVDVVKDPVKTAKGLAKPYETIAKEASHGKADFIKEHPVTAALMLQPAVRAPGLVAGKAARVAGAQTLARESATLPNTALREVRVKSRSAGRNLRQTVADRKATTTGRRPIVTARQVDTRVDESYAAAQKHSERVKGTIIRRGKKAAKDLKLGKPERKEFLGQVQEDAQNAAVRAAQRRTAHEFGATHVVHDGEVHAQPGAEKGTIFDNKGHADAVRDHLNEQGQTIPKGYGGIMEGHIAGRKYRDEPVPVQYVTRDAGGGKYAVVPQQVQKRLHLHSRIGKERAVPAIVLRQTRKALTKTVLPTRPSWLSGQAIEGGVRLAVARAGPLSMLRAARLARRHPELYASLEERAVPGGVIGRAAAHEIADRTLHEEFHGESDLARRLTEWGQKPGVKQTRGAYDAYTRFVFDKVNGKFLEGVPQKAMLGRALKQSPLMDNHLLGLSNKAIDEAARGLRGTETQAHLAREVTRAYGKYAAFSPRLRSLIIHWTPFIPWYLNTAKFLGQTLPRNHPMMAALLADMSAATEDWRKQQGLSLRYKNENSLPGWMLGGYPIQGGKNLIRVGHYLPSLTDQPTSDFVSLVLPQFAGAYGALKYGKDWKGDDLKHSDGKPYNEGEKVLYATQQLIESMVPLVGQGTQIATSGKPGKEALKSIRPIGVTAIHRDRGGKGVELPGLELSPLQIQQLELGG